MSTIGIPPPLNSPAGPTTSAPFHIRPALFREQASIARVCTRAFWDDVLFGKRIHPFRAQHPADNDLYWLRSIQPDWWDWSHVFLVAVEPDATTGRDVVMGQAHWSRNAPSMAENHRAGWGLRAWDPRRLLKPLFHLYTRLWAWWRPNRAADPAQEDVIERSYHFLDHVWTGDRARSWYLESLAVDPRFQNRGVGRKLVSWGLEQAEKEGISASVIAADGKENFYQRCGFDVGPVGNAGEGEGNPLNGVPGGFIFFREPQAKDGTTTPTV